MDLHDRIDPWKTAALHAALDRPGPAPAEGDPLPPLWHWMFFLEARRRSELGHDGHPAVGGFIPDMGLPRRMWAGGRLSFHAPLPIGAPARRTSRVLSSVRKEGRTGPLAFVTLEHEIHGPAGLAVREEQDLVYRAPHDPAAPRPAPPVRADAADWERRMQADATLLFRYSALTFNGHRIHYDLAFAREAEGYDGLVVHGPLMAQLMADLAREAGGRPLASFTFRGASPLTDGVPFAVRGRAAEGGAETWVTAPGDRLVMTGSARWG